MPSIPLLLQNDQILYDALLQAGALSGGDFPPENSFFGKLAFRKRSFSWLWNAFVSKKFCSRLAGDPYTAFAKPVFLHYHNFRSFGQMLEYPNGTITVDLLSALPDGNRFLYRRDSADSA